MKKSINPADALHDIAKQTGREVDDKSFEAAAIVLEKPIVKLTWTDEEFREFKKLSDGLSSRDQVTRIQSRMKMSKFIELHGTEKCDAMFELFK